ncbi:uncharacterized protein TNCV_480321 [Trichonephila clavipes]|nr:uncharacterized protein TNCV_480321 [Trichonephila clavipes]
MLGKKSSSELIQCKIFEGGKLLGYVITGNDCYPSCAEDTLANIRNNFWIPSARNVVRKILRTCITCWKVSAKGSQQLMADLPAARVTACRVFSQVVQIEAVLNSQPICPLSNDPNDVETLTPAHFLVGSSVVAVPDPDYTEILMNRLNQWQLVQRMNQHFWRKWSSEYLNRLQQCPKWCKGNVGFKELRISQTFREFR